MIWAVLPSFARRKMSSKTYLFDRNFVLSSLSTITTATSYLISACGAASMMIVSLATDMPH